MAERAGYTPTTDVVRDAYDRARFDHRQSDDSANRAAFDRWLTGVRAEAFNAGLSRAAEIADQYAKEAREYRDNETDYPESRVGMQHHGMYHGAQDVVIRIRAAVAETMGEPRELGSA